MRLREGKSEPVEQLAVSNHIRELEKRVGDLEDEIVEWKEATMLLDTGGDTDRVSPEILEQEIRDLQERAGV